MAEPQKPSIGRIVQYTLSEGDADEIADRRATSTRSKDDDRLLLNGNPVREGDVFPLLITRVWSDVHVNGQVHLDGNDLHWATSVSPGEGPGTWRWPERV